MCMLMQSSGVGPHRRCLREAPKAFHSLPEDEGGAAERMLELTPFKGSGSLVTSRDAAVKMPPDPSGYSGVCCCWLES